MFYALCVMAGLCFWSALSQTNLLAVVTYMTATFAFMALALFA